MRYKELGNKQIIIRPLLNKDLKAAAKFRNFLNSLIKENARISTSRLLTLKEEISFLKSSLKGIKSKKKVILVAEDKNSGIVAGLTNIHLKDGRQSHVGYLGISIRNGYRGAGLGSFLMREIIRLAKKELKPRPKILRLSVFPDNKPALKLYKKFGFKQVAFIPRQFEYKGKLLNEVVMVKLL
jgi:ribosomal protein S18 acetylase RimI-like enzyme